MKAGEDIGSMEKVTHTKFQRCKSITFEQELLKESQTCTVSGPYATLPIAITFAVGMVHFR